MMTRLAIGILLLLCLNTGAASLIGPLTLGTNVTVGGGGSITVNSTATTNLIDGPIITITVTNGEATFTIATNVLTFDLLSSIAAGKLMGRGEGSGDGPPQALDTDTTAYIQLVMVGTALEARLITNNIALLDQPNVFSQTNFFQSIVSTNTYFLNVLISNLVQSGTWTYNGTNVAPLIFAADPTNFPAASIGTLTATNVLAPITTLAPASAATNFTIDFNAGRHQFILATNNVHLLNFPNMPPSGFSTAVRLTILPSGASRIVSVRDGANVTNIRTSALLLSPFTITNAFELEVRAMVGTGVTNIAVFGVPIDP